MSELISGLTPERVDLEKIKLLQMVDELRELRDVGEEEGNPALAYAADGAVLWTLRVIDALRR